MKLQSRDTQCIFQNPQRFMPGIGNPGLSQRLDRTTI
jgi:hypothetical protein